MSPVRQGLLQTRGENRMGFMGISETFRLGLIIPKVRNVRGVVYDPGTEFRSLLIPLHQLHAPIPGKDIPAQAA